jgi:hypothetical protein
MLLARNLHMHNLQDYASISLRLYSAQPHRNGHYLAIVSGYAILPVASRQPLALWRALYDLSTSLQAAGSRRLVGTLAEYI